MPKLRLMWPVDPLGYKIEPAKALPKPPVFEPGKATEATKRAWRKTHIKPILMGEPGPMIVGNGGRLIFKDVLALEDGLCHRLADTPRTNAGVLGFVDEFGLLTHGVSELLEDFYANIAVAKRLVKMKKTHHYDGYVEWMAVHRTKIRLHPELQYPPTGGPPQLFFGPGTLFDAIWLQFFQEVSNSTQLRPCKRPGCLTWVAYGPGTGHRHTGEFCSKQCASAYRYQMRKEEEKR